ncbi:MAG: type I methionyl aminopeptidase [Myxococcota bacterium]|jgi:methionyl aminopeptidase|nr:type I methionyl aminopeptidase [Myxococcota bacterium]
MTITNEEELEGMRAAGKLAAMILEEMLDHAEVGMTTGELDAFGVKLMEEHGANSAPQSVGFPAATCISLNEEVAHGIPGDRVIEEGDVLNVDVSLELDGFFADNGATIPMGEGADRYLPLIDAAREARDHSIRLLRAGAPFNILGRVFEQHARRGKFKVIRNLCSHGIGRSLHEEPSELLGFYDRFDRRKFHHGQVITVEPFMSTATNWVDEASDGWTLLNTPGGRSAQFEHTLVILKGREPEILTLPPSLSA